MADVTRTRAIEKDGIRVEARYTFSYDEFTYPDWDPWDPETDPLHVKDGGSWDENLMELARNTDVVVTVTDPEGAPPSSWQVTIRSGASDAVWETGVVTAAAPLLWRPRGQIKLVKDVGAMIVERLS